MPTCLWSDCEVLVKCCDLWFALCGQLPLCGILVFFLVVCNFARHHWISQKIAKHILLPTCKIYCVFPCGIIVVCCSGECPHSGQPLLAVLCVFLIWCWIPQNFTWHHFIFTQFKILVEFKKLLKNARIYKNNCSVGNALHNVAKYCGMLYNRYIVWQWITNWIVISC